MVDSGINGLDGRHAMAAFIMLGFFQMMLGRLQGFQGSLHVRLIVVIITCHSSNRNAQETQNDRKRKQPGKFPHGNDLPYF
jgi:hypothetical protein